MESKEMVRGEEGYCLSPQPYPAVERRHAADTKLGCGGVGEHFTVEDLLDFSNDDNVNNAGIMDGSFDAVTAVAGSGASAESSTVTVVDSCNSTFSRSEPHFAGEMGSRNFGDNHFSGDLCVPYDDLAELEWLSNFVEESFSSEDLQRLQLISGSGVKVQPADEGSETREFQPEPNRNNSPIFRPEVSVPGKARSKRSRAAPCNWTSRLLVLTPTTETDATGTGAIPSGKKAMKGLQKECGAGGGVAIADGRKCLHCATDKTPQWRTGPMGPKTLCNACGVRYKSGRLVPEYRPAASPTFVLTKHSNSHRKVLELRRQKEMMRSHSQSQSQSQSLQSHSHQQQQVMHHHHHHRHQYLPPHPHHQGLIFDVTNGDDYLIHQHMGPDFRQLI